MSTREEHIARAGARLAAARAHARTLTPREAAEAAYTPGYGPSLDELEAMIRARRGLT